MSLDTKNYVKTPKGHCIQLPKINSYSSSRTSTRITWHMARLNHTSPLYYGQIRRGLGNPAIHTMPRAEYVLKGAKKATLVSTRRRIHVTLPVLRVMKAEWQRNPAPRDEMMLWAATCLCFFGFLRSGEIVCPTEFSFDPQAQLAFSGVVVDDRAAPSALRIHIKESKTDPFRQGVSVHIGWTGEALCPVTALLRYMAARGGDPDPLFTWVDGRFLTRKTFVAGVRAALTSAGYPAANYAGHSFRIGAATTAAQRGVQDSLIQTLGRWQSSAYTRYIQTAPKTLRGVARTLVQGRES